MTRRLLVVAAENFELAPIRRAVENKAGFEYVFVANGPGESLAEAAMMSAGPLDRFDAVVSTGICGGLVEELAVGAIVIGTSVNGEPVAVPNFDSGAHADKFHHGEVMSVNYVVGTAEEKKRLRVMGAIAVEMEAAAVTKHARLHAKPCYCIKAVSDTANESFQLDLNAARDEKGRFSVPKILWQAASSPVTVFPELGRLRRNSRIAASALGEFFAHCSF